MASRYESVRRQLDTLLGPDRNVPLSGRSSRRPHPATSIDVEAPNLCKDYILGFCLSSLSIKRRGTSLVCAKVHSDEARRRVQDLVAQGRPPRDYVNWHRELIDNCRSVVGDEDRRIAGVARRLKESYGFSEPPSAIIVQNLRVLQELGILVSGVLSADAQVRNVDDEEDISGPSVDIGPSDVAVEHSAEPEIGIKILGVASGDREISSAKAATGVVPAVRGDSSLGKKSEESKSNGKDHSEGGEEFIAKADGKDTGKDENTKNTAGEGHGEAEDERKDDRSGKAENLSVDKGGSSPSNPEAAMRSKLWENTGTGPGGLLLNREYKQRVCGQCGGLISLHDAETRLASHYAGKQHTSLVSLREKLLELETSVREMGSTLGRARGDHGHRDGRLPRADAPRMGRDSHPFRGRQRSRSRSPRRRVHPSRSRSRSRSRSPRHQGHNGRRRRSPDPYHHRGFTGPDPRHGFKRYRQGSPRRHGRRDGHR